MTGHQDGTAALDTLSDPSDFYNAFQPAPHMTSPRSDHVSSDVARHTMPRRPSMSEYTHVPAPKSRSFSRSPTRTGMRSTSNPVTTSTPALASVKSNPSFPTSRAQQRSIKDIVNRFNETAGPNDLMSPENQNKLRKQQESGRTRLIKARSPTKTPPNYGANKLHSKRASPSTRAATSDAGSTSPVSRSAGNSFDSSRITSPSKRKLRKPLFGEVIFDNSGMYDAGFGIPTQRPRRGSEGSLHLSSVRQNHGRSQSNAENHSPHMQSLQNGQVPSPITHTSLGHQRSQSDLSTMYSKNDLGLLTNGLSAREHSFVDSPRVVSPERRSRIPISARKTPTPNPTSPVTPRSYSAMTPPRNLFPAPNGSANRGVATSGNEHLPLLFKRSILTSATARRYDPIASKQAEANRSLKAYISAPMPKKSPPLRSSRPRQPVSAASTAASRGKVTERFAPSANADLSLGSEARSRRKIPQLGKVDFAERRAKIQRAISQNLREEDQSSQGSVSRKSSVASNAMRTSSVSDAPDSENVPLIPSEYTVSNEQYSAKQNHEESRLTIRVDGLPEHDPSEPLTAHTEFETDESPVLGETSSDGVAGGLNPLPEDDESPAAESTLGQGLSEVMPEVLEPGTLLSHVMKMRERSTSSASRTDFADDSASEIDKGSIQIILDGEPCSAESEQSWEGNESFGSISRSQSVDDSTLELQNEHLVETVLEGEPSAQDLDATIESVPETPRRPVQMDLDDRDEELTPRQNQRPRRLTIDTVSTIGGVWSTDSEAYSAINRIIDQYQEAGTMTPEMLHEFQRHVVNLSPNLSKADGSDATTLKTLLDNFLAGTPATFAQPFEQKQEYLPQATYSVPGTDSSPELGEDEKGTAIIYSTSFATNTGAADESDTQLDTDCETQPTESRPGSFFDNREQLPSLRYREADATAGADAEDLPPIPPPKDFGYSPRSSIGHRPEEFQRRSARISQPVSSQTSHLSLPEIETGEGLGLAIRVESPKDPNGDAPPLPKHSPPPPPSPAGPPTQWIYPDIQQSSGGSSMPTSPASLRYPEDYYSGISTSGRPSIDSQKPGPATLPASQSVASFQYSARGASIDHGSTSTSDPRASVEQRRLFKRRNIIKELVDTEFSYHQDMKIIEDIYKATVGELITTEDKKGLFGNADQVEAFSLEFYDALRRAVASVYVPPKSSRWHSKRGSFSTSNSGGTDQASTGAESLDDERDRRTTVGEVFTHFIPRMEKVYGSYLKNHDSANQTLSRLQSNPTVKCWLAECHNNASDITSAWDLDSLLVKPVQRILKYPLLLQQLLETTPADHPDHKMLEAAVKETMNVSHRINEAKKRADLVESIVNRKRKESDVRSGLAKAFGRRTEKLKERVGIAEAYQDPEFDELAHKFGGHFIRLQVAMRDVQGSLTETDRAVERFNAFAMALEAYVEVGQSTIPEIESKWRKYALAIRELTAVALPEHKAEIKKHVIDPMIVAIKLHEGPQNAITKRKKRIVDYAKCKAIERRGEKPDKKTVEASELYEALNEQLKIDLPKLYSLTADLIQACLARLVDIQKIWHWTWKRKLEPVLESFPQTIGEIVPAFIGDHDIIHSQLLGLGLCNGSMLADTANFLSPQTTLTGDEPSSSYKRPSALSSNRTMSVGSEHSPSMSGNQEFGEIRKIVNGAYSHSPIGLDTPPAANGQHNSSGRMRSSSSLSNRSNRGYQVTSSAAPPPLPRAFSNNTPKSSFSASRPSTATRPSDLVYTPSVHTTSTRPSMDINRSPRPASGASYFTVSQEPSRFSGMFSSAMPMSDSPSSNGPTSPKHAPDDTPVMFVAASLFEFNIDRARREAGYPYLTYVQGEVFDVVAQKGELWLAKNQDDQTNSLGWIWEQHFVILSQDP